LYLLVEVKVVGRRHLRKWRRRGRRGQVAAVATILGLLLVVTFIANYLSATLPGQMSVNELNHDVQVENQVGRLQALLEAASAAGAVGAQFSQPITLGGTGDPPFAAADSGSLTPGNSSGEFKINFTASLPATAIGSGPSVDGAAGTGACTGASPTRCPSGTWFTLVVTPTVADDLLVLEVTLYEQGAALTAADVSSTAGSAWTLVTAGGNGYVNHFVQYVFWTIDPNTGADTVSVGVAGLTSHDGSGILIAVKNVNAAAPISATSTSNGHSTTAAASVSAPAFALVLGLVSSSTASGVFPTITAGSAGTPCTAACTALASKDSGAFGETFGESEPAVTNGTYTASATLSASENWGDMAVAVNPEYTVEPAIPLGTGGTPPGASLVVHLQNVYTPAAEVAFDQGGVVFAQSGSVPVFVDAPSFSFSQSSASLWIPVFQGTFPVESGLGTTDLLLTLVSTTTFQFPNSGLTLLIGSQVTLSIETPYWAAWMALFESVSGLPASDLSCHNLAGVTCPSLNAADYQPGGPLAIVTAALPATALTLQIATFAISES
jgi:hypothetical protein